MKYGQVEAALVSLFEVDKPRLGAFKARIRHLRNFDCPSTEKVGTGSTAEYSEFHALQLAIALAFEQIGLSPKHSAGLAISWAAEISAKNTPGNQRFLALLPDVGDSRASSESSSSSDDGLSGLCPGAGQSLLCESAGELLRFAELMHAMSFVNVSKLVRDLEQALKQAEAA
jgi:hypothetical protein